MQTLNKLQLATRIFALLTLSMLGATNSHGAPGDVLETLTISNSTGTGQPSPTGYQGIATHNGYLWVVDVWSDRIYRVYPEIVYDEDGVTVLYNPGDSDFNIPIPDNVATPACPQGVCGGGSLTFARNFFWNASLVTDDIIKLDPVDGDNLESENTLATQASPSPLGMTFDGTHFWIVDWQSNTINKVLPENGQVIDTIPGPSTLASCGSQPYDNVQNCARPFGIAWDGKALWVTEREEQKIYRVNPASGDILTVIENPSFLNDPLGLAWDGQFLWVTNRDNGTASSIHKVDSGITPFGIMGCVEKNGIGIDGDVLLSQAAQTDQSTTTDGDGCFLFADFASGVPLSVEISESGNDKKPVLSLTGGDVTLLVGDTYSDPGVIAADEEDGDISANVTAVPDVFNVPSLIDTSVPGPTEGTTITYNVIDSAGNAADPITRTVYVLEVDTIPPVITLNGDNPLYVEQGTSYVEPGATAIDARDGDISDNLTITGSVNSAIAGTYTLDYDVTDATNNIATTVTRTVIVQDTTKPSITLLGTSPLTLEKGDTYIEAGATATDNIDGDISGSISIAGSVSTNLTGTYVLTYNVSDIAGNAATTATRTVQVVDTTPPTLTLFGATSIDHELQQPFTEPGYSATDAPGEDLTGSVIITGNVDSNTTGTYTLTYNVTDTAGNSAITQTRTVNVADRTAPVLTITGDNPLSHELGNVYVEQGATATDAIEGDLAVTIGGDTVNGSIAGTYNVSYDVSDSAGNITPTQIRQVIVADSTPPTVILNGSPVVEHELGTTYSDAGANAFDNIDLDITANIVVGGDTVDTSTIGDYTITYSVTDSSGNTSAIVTRLIQVSDRTAPVITLLGSNPADHEVGTVYNDAGATATDNIDGLITNNIGVTGSVNASVIGTYTLTYNVQDSSGNAATTVTRTVNVVDTGAPTITLIGSNPILHELQTPFTDPGATASDAADGDLGSVIATGTVDSSIAGTYTLTYNVTDSQSNAAPTVTRDVVVADRTAPLITLNGAAIIQHEQGIAFSDPGATASDVIDDDATLTAAISVAGTVDANTAGTYILTYDVIDAAGNAAAQVTRTVNVTDTTAPVIALNGSTPIEHEVGTVYVDQGATASDNIDGDISSSIGVSGSVDAGSLGTYVLTYNVQDSSGNTALAITRTVNVIDTGSPTINLLGDNPILHELNIAFTDPGATASDALDGDLTSSIVTTGTVDPNTAGTYTLTYNVADSQSNPAATVTRDIIVADRTKPTITLIGAATLNHDQGTTYTDQGATANDNIDGNISGSIVPTGSVAANSAGTYVLNYNVIDSSGNAADTVSRTVIVADTTAPVITLTGAVTVNVEQGASYTDAGATASDDLDGNVTAGIAVSGDTVDPNTAGTYIIRYDVTDAAGNNATQVIRTVTVADTTAPSISLTGTSTINHEQGTAFTDLGATATDSVDGTVSVTVGGDTVDPNIAGTYVITYDATDIAGNNAAQLTRTVVVADTTAPAITLNGASTVNVEQGSSYSELGASASDIVDGAVAVTIGGDTVNPAASGTYIVTYDAIDAAGNTAQDTRTVIVADTTPPTLTLLGAATVNLEQQVDTYSDAGATASDNIDGDISINISVSGDIVDPNTAGTYIIQYDVSDAAGNSAAPITRTVIVADTTAPVITRTGLATISVERGNSYTDAGATAADNIDGDISGNIVATGTVNTLVSGDYTISYNVTDASGNAATQVQRTVQVRDTGTPTLTLIGSANVNQEQGIGYTDAGASAEDLPSEDISGSIVVSGSVDVNIAGIYVLTYNVDDLAGNSAPPVNRTVTVADTTAPVIALTGSTTVNIEQGTSYTDAGATATDTVDGSVAVTVGGDTVDANISGTYVITYDAVDTAGNSAAQLTRTVVVADTIIPTITLSGATSIDLVLGQIFVDPGFSATDNTDGNLDGSVAVSGSIDINTEGTYVLSYDVSDAAGNAAATQTRTVNVVTPTVVSFEAETASIGGAHTVENDIANNGFTGSGYIQHSGEGHVEYTFDAFAIPYDLVVRYAWDTGDRPLEVILNGVSLGILSFPATGTLASWTDTAKQRCNKKQTRCKAKNLKKKTFALTPISGSNTLRLETIGSSGANLDSLTLTPQ